MLMVSALNERAGLPIIASVFILGGVSLVRFPTFWKQIYAESSHPWFLRKYWQRSSLRMFQMMGIVIIGIGIYTAFLFYNGH